MFLFASQSLITLSSGERPAKARVKDLRMPLVKQSCLPLSRCLKRSRVDITPAHEADHLSMGMSLIASTRGVGQLPVYAQKFLASSLTSRPLKGDTPTVDLVLSYKKSNGSPILKLLLSRFDELIARVSKAHSLRP